MRSLARSCVTESTSRAQSGRRSVRPTSASRANGYGAFTLGPIFALFVIIIAAGTHARRQTTHTRIITTHMVSLCVCVCRAVPFAGIYYQIRARHALDNSQKTRRTPFERDPQQSIAAGFYCARKTHTAICPCVCVCMPCFECVPACVRSRQIRATARSPACDLQTALSLRCV